MSNVIPLPARRHRAPSRALEHDSDDLQYANTMDDFWGELPKVIVKAESMPTDKAAAMMMEWLHEYSNAWCWIEQDIDSDKARNEVFTRALQIRNENNLDLSTAMLLDRANDILAEKMVEFENEYHAQGWGKTYDGKYPAEERLKVAYANITARLFEGMSNEDSEIALVELEGTNPRGFMMSWLGNETYQRRALTMQSTEAV
jgi:hypothetical protein